MFFKHFVFLILGGIFHMNFVFLSKKISMQENQNIEWKESWRDEYIKWIAGFANATGCKHFIGIDDSGVVSGLTEAHLVFFKN